MRIARTLSYLQFLLSDARRNIVLRWWCARRQTSICTISKTRIKRAFLEEYYPISRFYKRFSLQKMATYLFCVIIQF